MITDEQIKEILYRQFLKDSVHFFDRIIVEKLENLIRAGYNAAKKEIEDEKADRAGDAWERDTKS